MIKDNMPKYTKIEGRYGDLEYSYIEEFCSQCGYVIKYDGKEDDEGSVIHMGKDEDYSDVDPIYRKHTAKFDLAKKLAKRLYKRHLTYPESFYIDLGFPSLRDSHDLTEEMIINSWADFFIHMCSKMESRAWIS